MEKKYIERLHIISVNYMFRNKAREMKGFLPFRVGVIQE